MIKILIYYLFIVFVLNNNYLLIESSTVPMTHDDIQIIKAKLGTKLQLNCTFDKIESNSLNNELKIIWIKENKGVLSINNNIKSNIKKYSIKPSNGQFSLIINNLTQFDSGNYLCQHLDYSQIKLYRLQVLIPPKIPPSISYKLNNNSIQLLNQNNYIIQINENDNIELNCSSDYLGNPNSYFKWYSDDTLVNINGQLTLLKTSSLLNNQRYTCVVESDALDEPFKLSVMLNVTYKPIVKLSILKPKTQAKEEDSQDNNLSYTIVENSTETLLCAINSNPEPFRIEWYRNDIKIDSATKDRLILNETSSIDSGNYKCKVFNRQGSGEADINLDVMYSPKVNMMPVYSAAVNDELRIECLIDSNPQYSNISWYLDDIQLKLDEINDEFSAYNYIDKSILIIKQVKKEYHNLTVKCLVNNELYNSEEDQMVIYSNETKTTLNILFNPEINKNIKKIAIDLNTNIRLECKAKLNPFGDVYWKINDDLIEENNDKYEIINTFDRQFITQTSLLVINSIDHLDIGFYSCHINNSIGYDYHVIELMLPTLPNEPINLSTLNITSSSVLVQWIPEFDGGSEQSFELLLNNQQKYETIEDNLLIQDLSESTEYEIKIRSKNEYGFSNWSLPILFKTNEYEYSIKDIKLNFSKIETKTDYLVVNFHRQLEENKILKYLLKIDSIEFIEFNGTTINLNIDNYFTIDNTQINVSICIQPLNRDDVSIICNNPLVIDLNELKTAELKSITNETQPSTTNKRIFNFIKNRLTPILIAIFIALVLIIAMIGFIFGLYRYLINRSKVQSNDNNIKESSNPNNHMINTSPISAYGENTSIKETCSIDNQAFSVDLIDTAYSSCEDAIKSFSSTRIQPIPEVNEDLISDDGKQQSKKDNLEETDEVIEFPLYDQVTPKENKMNPFYETNETSENKEESNPFTTSSGYISDCNTNEANNNKEVSISLPQNEINPFSMGSQPKRQIFEIVV